MITRNLYLDLWYHKFTIVLYFQQFSYKINKKVRCNLPNPKMLAMTKVSKNRHDTIQIKIFKVLNHTLIRYAGLHRLTFKQLLLITKLWNHSLKLSDFVIVSFCLLFVLACSALLIYMWLHMPVLLTLEQTRVNVSINLKKMVMTSRGDATSSYFKMAFQSLENSMAFLFNTSLEMR